MQTHHQKPLLTTTPLIAGCFVLSGVTQPLIMTLAKEAGLANPKAQLYMVFYYLGPSLVSFWITQWPPWTMIFQVCAIAVLDVAAQALNYTGSTLAGPTLFSIIYSSVTIWTAVFSRLWLHRRLTWLQWCSVWIVFFGLAVAALHSFTLGKAVLMGSCAVGLGSMLHSMTYVLSETLMKHSVTVQVNCALQGLTACVVLMTWQLVYIFGLHRWNDWMVQPVLEAETTAWQILFILGGFGMANLVHSLSFFFTLAHLPGGAASAGVLKALQAVLVFVATSLVYCGRLGGPELCVSKLQLLSLVLVVGGVVLFGHATKQQERVTLNGYQVIAQEAVIVDGATMNGGGDSSRQAWRNGQHGQ